MSNTSKIEWTDATWNPVTGCTKVSQGCKNCYAEKFYERFNGKGSFKTITCHDDRLEIPLHWKKPRMVFVNSMSDLFHEEVGFNFIYKVFEMMHLAKQHTFQVLTKRAERLEILNDVYFHLKRNYPASDFPLPNVWLGISCEDQATANERIPFLLNTPAAIRFLSCEPLLGPIDIMKARQQFDSYRNFGRRCSSCTGAGNYHDNQNTPCPDCDQTGINDEGIDWVITGGESGPGARPMHPDWVRGIRDQCKAAGVSFFFKQWGEYAPIENGDCSWTNCKRTFMQDLKQPMIKAGKKKAGNILDGVQHLEFPVEPQKEQKKTKEKF